MATKLTTFDKGRKSYPVLEIYEENMKYPLRIGRAKCRLILKNLEAVKTFAESE